MKRLLCVICVLLTVGTVFTACAKQSSTEVVNPIKESSYEEIKTTMGIDLPAPKDATNVVYSTIEGEKGLPYAQMDYEVKGQKIYIRAVATDLTAEKLNLVEPDAQLLPVEAEKTSDELSELAKSLYISGLYYEWDAFALQDVGKYNAITCRKDQTGYIAWIDGDHGILYNLCMESGADDNTLTQYANDFVQGQK